MIYQGNIESASYGYTQAALLYLASLQRVGRQDVSIVPTQGIINWRQMPRWAQGLGQLGAAPNISRDVSLAHHLPGVLASMPLFGEKRNVGLTTLETDEIPRWLGESLSKRFGTMIVPSEHNRQAMRAGGFTGEVQVIGHPMFPEWWNLPVWGTSAEMWRTENRPFTFYFVGTWNARKNPEAVLRAYLRAFPGEKPRSDVALALKLSAPRSFDPLLQQIVREETGSEERISGDDNDVWAWTESWPEERVRWLHEIGDCFVSAHHGEGWGLGLFQAASLGRRVIYTDWSAPTEFLSYGAGHLPVSYDLVDVGLLGGNHDLFYPSAGQTLRWARPRDFALVDAMQRAYEERHDQSRQSARDAHALWMRDQFSLERIGQRLVEVLGV